MPIEIIYNASAHGCLVWVETRELYLRPLVVEGCVQAEPSSCRGRSSVDQCRMVRPADRRTSLMSRQQTSLLSLANSKLQSHTTHDYNVRRAISLHIGHSPQTAWTTCSDLRSQESLSRGVQYNVIYHDSTTRGTHYLRTFLSWWQLGFRTPGQCRRERREGRSVSRHPGRGSGRGA